MPQDGMTKKLQVYLADLTHDGPILSSNVFPLSIGLVGAYLLKMNPDTVEVELFKYPDDLSTALERRRPEIIGFANYSWNIELSYGYAKAIKKLWPEVVVVFGGPNYGLSDEEANAFWQRYSLIDAHIVKEGEKAFADLFARLAKFDFDFAAAANSRPALGNCHYRVDGEIVKGPLIRRIDIDSVPSPYLMGLMDKFFDENLGPMIHTTRGCPFRCAFCTEGQAYFNVVRQRTEGLADELDYIATRVVGPRDLYITDANFGMFKQDLVKAAVIADCQKRHGYPTYIHVSTGKNQKARVLEVAAKLGGTLNLAASLQSTDPIVLKNVSRSNISSNALVKLGMEARRSNTGTYSEIILGLPGDSLAAHMKSVRDAVEAGFENVRMYQLIMLPETELATPSKRREFRMRTLHRIMPRSFGRYRLVGERFTAVESEEIVVETATLPFEDYAVCREFDLTVEILHNGRVFGEVQGLCRSFDLRWFDFVERFFEKRRDLDPAITNLFDVFRRNTVELLWDTRDALTADVANNIDRHLVDEQGTNEMSIGKSTAYFDLFRELNAALFREFRAWLEEIGLLDAETAMYIEELERFSLLRKQNMTDPDDRPRTKFKFDFPSISARQYAVRPSEFRHNRPVEYVLSHDDEQRALLGTYRKEFGQSRDGLGKMLMRYPHVHRIFRSARTSVV